jgi:hypothetical protein
LIASCGGKLTGAYFTAWDMYLWELVEAIEIVSEIQPKTESDIGDMFDE